MADPTLVNGQITDAVTQANVKVLADAPAQAIRSPAMPRDSASRMPRPTSRT